MILIAHFVTMKDERYTEAHDNLSSSYKKNPNIVDIKYKYIKSDIIKEQIKVVRYFKENNIIRKQLIKDLNRS